ncbi:MAG TPA: hypothetical protein VNB22_10585 [Pyrinomonadaceae bacterium]|jgi:hypothetical protein|nr:hypothetical protein [Pyrinomonadaceae bacterium]
MKINKIQSAFAILLIFICLGAVIGQNKAKSVGSIRVKINSNDPSVSGSVYDIPVNRRFSVRESQGFRIEASETGNIRQLEAVAIADKNNADEALLQITYVVAENRGRTKKLQKQIRLKKGQSKIFRIKYENVTYDITALYKPKNK